MESALLKLVKFGGRKTNYFRSVVFPTPKPPDLSLHDQRAGRPLDSGKWVGSEGFEFLAHGIGLDVRHGCSSVPCLAHVIGLVIGNGSCEHFVFRRLLSVVEVTRLGYMLGTVLTSLPCLGVY